jgi:predicted Zn-dependent protease
LPDGELEVRGTAFDVDVEDGATRRVQVAEGVVELRLRGQGVIRIGASESWPAAPDVVASAGPSSRISSVRPALPAASSPAAADSSAAEYAEGVERLREGRYDDAASRFRALVVAHPGAAEAEDASFLEAVALARAGRTDAAALAGEHHLSRFPRSFHAKEAAILVARAASQRHDCEKARRVLAPWATGGAASADVQGALGTCVAGALPQDAANER